MKFIGYVTVRLNSKRVPFKSIREISGVPLVSKAISILNRVDSISETILYCSQECIRNYIDSDLKYLFIERPLHLDGDNITFNDILESIIDDIDGDYIVFLSCTSPFIKPETIQDMIDKIETGNYDSSFLANALYSFCWFDSIPLNYELDNIPRTQDLKPVIQETSGLYIFSKELFKKYKRRIGFNPYIKIVDMLEGWDIDTMDELMIAECISRVM